MESARWRQVQELFHAAVEKAPPERLAFLQSACGEDRELAAEVSALLDEDAGDASLLDQNIAQLASVVLETSQTAVLGQYRTLRRLGEGGMGIVYLAEQEGVGRRVALKVLRDAWLSPSRRERFAAEQRTLAQLDHPSIARLYDSGFLDDGTPYFVMEYVEGKPLTEWCAGVPLPERLRLFRALCEAVQSAHAHAVVHRDLKPSNVLVKEDGSLRLLDFGIAKQLEEGDDLTRTGVRLFTPAYAAPEQFRGAPTGIRADVYSLGVVLYELLAGRQPFELTGCTPAEAESIVLWREPAKPSAVAPPGTADRSDWADLDVLVAKAMRKDPDRRYASVEALMRDLDHYLRSEALEARPDELSYRLRKFVARNRRQVAIVAAAGMLALAAAVFFTVRLAAARNAALAEAARAQRVQRFMLGLFEGDDKGAAPAGDLRVVSLLERGVQHAQALDAEPATQAELNLTLGSLYGKLGQLPRADGLLQAARDRREQLFGDGPEVAEALVEQSQLRIQEGKLPEAQELAERAVAMTRKSPDHPVAILALSALGRAQSERGQYAQAIASLQQVVRERERPGKPREDLAVALTDLADAQFYASNIDAAYTSYQLALRIRRERYGERHALIAESLLNLGEVAMMRGQPKDAESLYRRALEIDRAWYGSGNPETASALTRLGKSLVAEGRYKEAQEPLREALGIQERAYGPVNQRVAAALIELGSAAYWLEEYDEAEQVERRAVEIYRQVYGDAHYKVAISLDALGNILLDRKQWPQAEELYRDVVRRLTAAVGKDHVSTAIAEVRLSRSILKQKRYAESLEHSRRAYDVLTAGSVSSPSFLRGARRDLAEAYEALGEKEKAARYRAELAAAEIK